MSPSVVESALPLQSVDPGERITRYLTNPRWYNAARKTISAQAFKPAPPKPPERPVAVTSVYRTNGLSEIEMWDIGDKYVTQLHPDKPAINARADISADAIIATGLQLQSEPVPHPRHANIVNWPNEDEKRQETTALLAVKAILYSR